MVSDNGGQKCWDLSSDITKTSDPSPPTPNKVGFGAKWVKMSGFFLATTLLGEVGGRRDEPKAEQKIVLRSRVVHNNCLEGLFTQSQVLLSSIVANQNRRHMSLRLCGTGKRCCALIRRRSIQNVWSVYDAGKKNPYFAQIETQREQYIIDL